MSVLTRLTGKVRAARTLFQIARRLKNWQAFWDAYRGLGPVPALQFRSGLVIEHSGQDDMVSLFVELFLREDYTCRGFYTPCPGDVILDVGANIGCFTLSQLQKCSTITVHAFEPSAKTRERFQHNLKLNHFAGQVTIHPYGLSDSAKELVLDEHHLAGSRSAMTGNSEQGEVINCISLGEAMRLCQVDRVALLKMDIEGAEVDVFQESARDVWNNIDRIALEFHGTHRPGVLQFLQDRFAQFGFQIVRVYAPTPDGQDGVLQARRVAA